MTVEELIEILKTFSSDLEVKFSSTEDGMDEIDVECVASNHEDGGPLLM